MSGDSILGWFRVFLPLTLIWILSSSTVKCQECSTSGLNVFGGYQYVFYHGTDGVLRTFSETRALCQSLGGNMPIITSAEQNDFIAGKLLTNDRAHYYIGLEDIDQDGTYRWIDETDPGYTNWDSPLYTDQQPPYCAVMRSGSSLTDPIHGRWNRVACTSTSRHICQIPIDNDCRWQELGESQYLIKYTPRATPNDAREVCQSYGGDLAIIKTAEVNTFLKDLIPPSNQICYLFGLRRIDYGDFTWLDDTPLQYNDWYTATEPNNADSWGCLGLRADGSSWYDGTPQFQFPYICERTRVYDGSSEASFGGLDYFISPSWLARSYSDARIYCQFHGGDLALIKSHDINTFLHGRISGLNSLVFFGLTDQAVEGTFKWIDETPLQFSAWRNLEPDNAGDEDCATLSSDSDMGWLDFPCDLDRPFICERYLDVPEYKWTRLDGTLYYISQSSMTSYSFARKYCQAQGGDLAQPKTEEINIHLIDLAGGNSYWFGLEDTNQEGTFQWIDGTQLDNNEFPAWSDGDATVFENERCVHRQVFNGWRKLPCALYLRFACEKPPSPRQILPVRLMAATPSPYGGGLLGASFICLLSSENEEILTFSTRRLVRLTESITSHSYTAPGDSDVVSSVVLRQTLAATIEGLGFFECSAVTASRMTSVPLGILLSSGQLQPSDGRFTKTIHIGDDITLSVVSTTGMIGEDRMRWRKLTDVDWANSLIGMSSDSLSHTIQSASISDAGVYVTYMDGTMEQHQFSLIRLIVTECPYGSWNPPLCDRLCDSCYNGGVCHELSGTCICPPGHAGKNCLQACGMHKFGWDCEFECGPGQPLDKCAGSQICLPDPYGCTCLAGYTGIYCNETCADGMFGADCLQECLCTDGADCDDVTGECPGDCSYFCQGPTGDPFRPVGPVGPSGSPATVVGSPVGAIVVIVILIVLIIIIFYKRRSHESASTKSKGKESDSSPQYENPAFDQSQTDVHTYQDLNTDLYTYQDLNTDEHVIGDMRTVVASKTIQPSRGGTIQLPHYGISLCVPALALQKECEITLKVLAQPSSVRFAENEALVSHGVVCEPSGTTFQGPLKLVITHCAVLRDPSKAKVTLYFTHGDKKVTKKELSSTGIPRCIVRKDDLEVYIDHFSICEMFMVISDSFIGKRVASTPYLPKSMSRLLPQYCHLRLYNDTPGLEDLIETEEEKLDYLKMAPTKKMFVLWEKGELRIRCEVDSGHVTENEKTISLNDICRLDRNIVTFLVKATGNADVHFKFNFHPHCDEGHAFKAKFSDGDKASTIQPPSTASSMDPEGAASSSTESSAPLERRDRAQIESKLWPFTATSMEPEGATSSSTESSASPEKQMRTELPATPSRFDDKLLYEIAEEIETDEHLDMLMHTLEVTQGSQSRYHKLNRLEGHLTAKGTRQMMMDWRARTAVIEQTGRLKDALTRAGLLDLRDRFFPG